MARLILSLDSQVLAEYNMTKERYTIGRLPDNDVRIDNPAVSGHHSLVINILNDSFLEDLNSTNGTYVNGKLIKKHALQHGDVITVGHHQLRFVDQVDDDSDPDEFEKTMVIHPSSHSEEKLADVNRAVEEAARAEAARAGSKPAPEAVEIEVPAPEPSAAPPAGEPEHVATAAGIKPEDLPKSSALPTAKLQVLSGAFAGRELDLTKALTTLGRPNVQVAAITRRAEGYFIVHVDSGEEDNYPVVNGESIGPKALKLNDNDVIELAGVKMGFFASN